MNRMSAPSFPVQKALSKDDMSRISNLIYRRAGIVLGDQKRDMVYNRLSRRLRELRIDQFADYMALLESHSGAPEWQTFINLLTTNLTSFFREAYHFPVLAQHARAHKGMYTVWCAAASTGEEPVSVAITLDEALGSANIPRIVATDINTAVLQKARQGIYRKSDIEGLTEQQKRNYFLRGTGSQKDMVKVQKSILSAIQYQPLNLIAPRWDIPAPFNAIFCRNVMIYFDKKTQEQLILRFAKMLKPGGLLFVGHSEHFSTADGPFRFLGQSVYRLEGNGNE